MTPTFWIDKLYQSPSLISYIKSRVQINQEIEEAISNITRTDHFKKYELLLKEGQIAHRIYFIQKGSVRTFYLHDGKDISSWIYPEGLLVTSWSSFFARTPSYESIEILEDDAEIVSISFEDLQQLYNQYPKMQAFGRIMVEEQLSFLDHFYKGFMFMSAKEKYDALLTIFPDITQRVNLGHIASFLGISQETLSRIRRKN